MGNGIYKLIKENTSSNFDEKSFQATGDTVLGFNSTLDPKAISLLKKTNNAPVEAERIYGTQWYCDTTDRVYTWMGAWVDLHNTFPVKVTVSLPLPAVGDVYEGGIVAYVGVVSREVIIVCENPSVPGEMLVFNDTDYGGAQAFINGINETEYSDWAIPTLADALLTVEYISETLYLNNYYWWTSTIAEVPGYSCNYTVSWDGADAITYTDDITPEAASNYVFPIRKVTI